MSRIKFKVQSSKFKVDGGFTVIEKFKVQSSRQKGGQAPFKVDGGFTVIEMIVTLAILALIVVIASGFLFTTISSSKKVEVTKEVRQNGSYALSIMEGLIHTSRSVGCPDLTNQSFQIEDNEGFLTIFKCEDNRISSISASLNPAVNVKLTGENVTVSACDFSCTTDTDSGGRPVKVSLDFIVSQKSSITLRPSEKSTMRFQTEVVAKNYN